MSNRKGADEKAKKEVTSTKPETSEKPLVEKKSTRKRVAAVEVKTAPEVKIAAVEVKTDASSEEE